MFSLVTGAAGFCGRHLCEALLKRGHTVYAVDSMAPLTGCLTPEKWYFGPFDYDGFRWYQQDCREWFHQHTYFKMDYVFHLAAIVGGREMIEHNPLAVADDLSIDAAYWQWAATARPEKSVIFSSSAVYPVAMQTKEAQGCLLRPLAEWHSGANPEYIGVPDMTYGWAKMTMEFLSRVAYETHGLKAVCFRPFSGYGADQDLSYPFPALLRRVAGVRHNLVAPEAIDVWGDGNQIRDFIYINDCIRGVLSMVDKIDDGSAVNLSTGVGTSFRELIGIMADEAGYTYRPPINPLSSKPVGVFCRVGDTAKQKSLGFEAEISLREGIKKSLESISALRA